MSGLVFRQLFDKTSSTYTYIIGCAVTRLAAIVDPVYEQVSRDVGILSELDLKLKYAMNTHLHADHVTGTGALKSLTKCQSVISVASGAKADLLINDNDIVEIGNLKLEARSTPGHTSGCMTYVLHDHKLCLTGDTLMIRGCGRTDFQEGSPSLLYKSVHEKILSLPEDFSVYPAHDYQGRTQSSVREEKLYNLRLTKTKDEFINLMDNLGLKYPAKIDVSVPWNTICGPTEAEDKEIMAAIAANKFNPPT